MKKIFATCFLALCAMMTMAADIDYKVAPVSVKVEDNSTSTTPKFNLTIEQKSYRLSNSTKYSATTHLVLYPKSHDLAGTYTTSDNSLHPSTSDVTVDGSTRRPTYAIGRESTITIVKVAEGKYAIKDGAMIVSTMGSSNVWCYNFCYAMDEWDEKAQFEFEYSVKDPNAPHDPHANETKAHYDMSVKGVHVERNDDAAGETRYYMIMMCDGKRRDTGVTYSYEIQLNLHPKSESIVGTFATYGSDMVLLPQDSYVKWLQSNGSSKTRYLVNDKDTLNTITIVSKGTDQYSFTAGTLICQDITFGVMGEKNINQTLYYHFSESIDFGFNEENQSFAFTPTSISVEQTLDGYQYLLQGNIEGISYSVVIETETTDKAGTFTTANSLSLWSRVDRGANSDKITESGSTITISLKSDKTYSIYGTLLCESGKTYEIQSIDFSYPDDIASSFMEVEDAMPARKIIENGVLFIELGGERYTATGVRY